MSDFDNEITGVDTEINIDQQDLIALTHLGENPKNYFNAVTPPVILTSLHVFDDMYHSSHRDPEKDFAYGRTANPTVRILEEKIALLEHGSKAVVFSSGMSAAIAVILTECKANDHVIAVTNSYNPVRGFFDGYGKEHFNLSVTYVRGDKPCEFEEAIQPNTKLIMIESPTTFLFSLVDIKAVSSIAKKHGIKTYIDNTYCTPLLQKPLDMGIDYSMHTLSKYMGGHSDIIGGVIVSKDKEAMQYMEDTVRQTFGAILGPMEAWLVIRGLRTLDVRIRQHAKTALAVATFLENHPKVECVYYPALKSHPQYELMLSQQKGSSGLLGFCLKGSDDDLVKFVDSLKLFHIGCSWGGFESLVTTPHRGSTDEVLEYFGIKNNFVRIHCGLEGTENLIADLTNALNQI